MRLIQEGTAALLLYLAVLVPVHPLLWGPVQLLMILRANLHISVWNSSGAKGSVATAFIILSP